MILSKISTDFGEVVMVDFRGSRPHPSHDDPSDKEDVISVRLKDGDNKTMRRLHIHQDGSVKKINVG
jgi:hypothetical protein